MCSSDLFAVMEGLRALGVDVWFNLGDRDLAIGLERARLLATGLRLTEAHGRLARELGVNARVLPMSDRPVRTRVQAHGRWWAFQEFMIRARAEGPVDDVDYRGARAAAPTPEVEEALASARAIVIGPSNPVISIGPILALPGMRDRLKRAPAPVVAVSPVVKGEVLKPATVPLMKWAGHPVTAAGVTEYYGGVIDGMVSDEPPGSLPALETDVLMADADGRRRLADLTLSFALTL